MKKQFQMMSAVELHELKNSELVSLYNEAMVALDRPVLVKFKDKAAGVHRTYGALLEIVGLQILAADAEAADAAKAAEVVAELPTLVENAAAQEVLVPAEKTVAELPTLVENAENPTKKEATPRIKGTVKIIRDIFFANYGTLPKKEIMELCRAAGCREVSIISLYSDFKKIAEAQKGSVN